MNTVPRRIVWFSCGAASAVAAWVTRQKDPDAVVVYCDTSASEHPDNLRFRLDVEAWIGGDPIRLIKSEKYTTVEDVFTARKYMSGPKGAICTTELKKVPRFHFQEPDDIHIFGFTADEGKRVREFVKRNPDLHLEWPLLEDNIDKERCYAILRAHKIILPAMYGLGFKNNNCLGCVKATSPTYWKRVRAVFPEVFKRRCEQSRALGVRLIRLKGERVFLDELPEDPDLFMGQDEDDISCGPECGTVEVHER